MQAQATDSAAEQRQIDRLLAAARETIVQVPFCWSSRQTRTAEAPTRASSRRSPASLAKISGHAGF